MAQVYDEPIVVRLTVPVGSYPVGTEFGFNDVADAIRALGSSAYFTVVRTQDGDPIPPPTPEDMTEAEKQALARARAARLIRGADFDPLVPGPGEVIVGSEDGPVARDVSEIGGNPDAVSGVGVQRIIASTDPDYPLQNGDLLIIIETPTFFTDFASYETGSAPSDWTQPWAQTSWEVVDDAAATGGKLLRATNASGNGRRVLYWNGPNAALAANAEIVYKWRTSAASGSVRSVLRGSGAAASETGYMAGYLSNGQGITFGRYVAGAYTVMAGTGNNVVPITANTWQISRFRVEGDTLSFRTWPADQQEPETWHITASGSFITDAGFAGIMPFEAATTDFDWVGIAFDGESAPVEG